MVFLNPKSGRIMKKLVRLLLLTSFYGFCFFSPWSIAGAQAMLVVGLVGVVLVLIWGPRPNFQTGGIFMFIVLYYIVNLFSAALSGAFFDSLKSLRHEWIPLTFLIWVFLSPDENHLKRGIDIMVAVSGIFAFYACLQHFTGYDLVRGIALESLDRFYIATGPYGGHLTFGGVYFLIAFFILGYLAGSALEKGRRFYYYILFLFLALPAVILSYARSIWIAMAFSTAILVLLVFRKHLLKASAIILALCVLLVILFPPLAKRGKTLLDMSFDSNFNRVELWATSRNMIFHRPIVGFGSGGFTRNFEKYFSGGFCPVRCHPHNDYLNVLVETGIFGLLIHLGLFWLVLRRAYYVFKAGSGIYRGIALGSLLAVVGIMIAGEFECFFVDDEVEELLFFMFGLCTISYNTTLYQKGFLRRDARILLIRTDRIGDLILSTPVCDALKKSLPSCKVDFLVSKYASEIIRNDPNIENMYIKSGFISTARLMRKIKPEVAIFIHPTFDEALAGMLSGVPLRLGSGYRAYSFLFNIRHYEHRKTNKYHEVLYNCRMLKEIGIEYLPERIRVYLDEESRRRANELLGSLGVCGDYVVLHPGSLGSSLAWSIENYKSLAKIFAESNYNVIITGSEKEMALANFIAESSGKNVFNIAGKTDLLTLAGIFEKARIVITNSTGPLHIADGVGTSVLGIFPPSRNMSPTRWGPYNQPENIIRPPVEECERCVGKSCKFWYCMDILKPEAVFERAKLIMGRRTR